MPTLLLIDGHSLLFRAYHALPALATTTGFPTGAVYGFSAMLFKVLEEERPDAVLVVFDAQGPTFRHEAFAAYKAQRAAMPEDLPPQLEAVRELLAALGIPVLEKPGYEADDVIATLARKAEQAGWQCRIVSGDRDLLQLVSDRVTVLLTARTGISDLDRLDAEGVRRKLGVWPAQVPDLKGLMGDVSDNIPGVAGIGQKTAVEILNRYPTLEAVFSQLDTLPQPRWRKLLAGQEALALQYKRLATVDRDVPLEWTPPAAPFRLASNGAVEAVLQRYQLFSLLKRLGLGGSAAQMPPAPGAAAAPAPPLETWPQADVLAVYPDERDGWWVAAAEDTAAAHWAGALPTRPSEQRWVGWDVKAHWRVALRRGQAGVDYTDDAMLEAYLLNSERSDYRLESSMGEIGMGEQAGQPAWRAVAVARLHRQMEPLLKENGLDGLYRQVEWPLVRILAEMEAWGILVDRPALVALGEELDREAGETQRAIFALAGGAAFNLNSPQQLAEVLFERLGLPVIKRTKTGYSTDAEVLEQLAPLHPVVEKVLTYRQLVKLKGTYVDGLLPLIESDGRLHTTFNQTGTATGRLSSSDPNLQNIPVRLPLGRKIRAVFLPSPGRVLVAADYSQVELRILAHLSADPNLCAAFAAGEDIHRRTASEIFGIPWEAVDATWRSRAKAVNFGIVYGISDYGLARDTGVSRAEAADYIARYFARYPQLKAYLDHLVEVARESGYATTILGRRRPLPDIRGKNRARRQYAERMAMNTVIQGSAADLIKVAMVRLADAYQARGLASRLVLQVHDELIWDAVPDEVETVAALAREHMAQALALSVPLEVEVKTGPNWGELEPLADTAQGGAGHARTS